MTLAKVQCNLILKKPYIAPEHALKYIYSKCRLVNQVYTLPTRAPKPHLNYISCGKGRAGRAAGSEMGGKKSKSSERGGAGAFSVVTTFI